MIEMKHVTICPSKSAAHRVLICKALADYCRRRSGEFNPFLSSNMNRGNCECPLRNVGSSDDIEATEECLNALSHNRKGETAQMMCGESGSTLRFLLPVAAALGDDASFYPEGTLIGRTIAPLREVLKQHGCKVTPKGVVPINIKGQLMPGEYFITGKVSSQFVSGLLFALPLLLDDSRIIVKDKICSSGYVDLTISILNDFGIKISKFVNGNDTVFEIEGDQNYTYPESYTVEGDWSNAAIWLAAGVLGDSPIEVSGLRMDSKQPDKAIVDLLREFGADVRIDGDTVTAYPSHDLNGIDIDISQIPDLTPVLALVASVAEGRTTIYNGARLRLKESDRLRTTTYMLKSMGANILERNDGLTIDGRPGHLKGAVIDGEEDHRIVMTAAAASVCTDGKVTIKGSDAVNKSYPDFFDDLASAGLDANIVAD